MPTKRLPGRMIPRARLFLALSLGLIPLMTGGDVTAQTPPSTSPTAQSALTFTVSGVRDDRGKVLVFLCPEASVPFPGPCPSGVIGVAAARPGETTVIIQGVKAGAYAVQIVHDANGNGALNFPAEGYAFGNDATYPPSFATASITVAGASSTARARMVYAPVQAEQADPAMAFTAAGWVRIGSNGAPAPEGVTKTDVREQGLYGEFYAPAGKTGLPTLILLGGSEGGLNYTSYLAASFTRQGYAVLALAYFAETGLPRSLSGVPVEYFDRAVAWVKARPEVDHEHIGAIGFSRGSEAVLLMASRNRDIGAVLAVAPSNVLWPGLTPTMAEEAAWTEGGKPLPYARLDYAGYRPGAATAPLYLKALETPGAATIAVEAINGPVMLISGGDDQLWPSALMARTIEDRLKSKGFAHPVRHLSYPDAGHTVFGGDMTGRPVPTATSTQASAPGGLTLGGTPIATFNAASDSWPKVLQFFDAALKTP